MGALCESLFAEGGQTVKAYSRFVAMLGSEFHRYLMQHPEKVKQIPGNALVIFQVEGEENFNRWSQETALKNREKGQPAVYISVRSWREQPSLDVVRIKRAVA